jgi:periplasmic protein TonB
MTRADALDRRFGIALAASLVVHAAAMTLSLPAPKAPAFDPAVPLHVRLLQPQPVAMVHVPARPSAEVPRPAPAKRARPKRETAAPIAPKVAPSPPEPPVEAAKETPAEPPLALAPSAPAVDPAPALPVLPAPALPEAVPTTALLEGYGKRISDALARYKEYPRIAQLRGWEGAVTMRLRVAPSGRLVDAALHTSSGYDVLDKQAIAMATKAAQLPVPPDGVKGEVSVLVPVVFRLER